MNLRPLGATCGGGVPGVLAETLLLRYLDVHRYQRAVLLLVGVMVAGMALYNLYRMVRPSGAAPGTSRLGWVAAAAVPIGAEVGFSSAGAGALGSLVLLNLTSLTPAQVVGTDLCFGLVVSSAGGAWHLSAGDYNSMLLRGLVLGGLGRGDAGSVAVLGSAGAAVARGAFGGAVRAGARTLLEGVVLNRAVVGRPRAPRATLRMARPLRCAKSMKMRVGRAVNRNAPGV